MNQTINWKGNNGVEKATHSRMGCDINNTLLCIPETKTKKEKKKKDIDGGIIMLR